MGRACGEPDEIGLTAMGVKLNGSRRVRGWQGSSPSPAAPPPHLTTRQSGKTFRVGTFLDFVWRSGTTRTMHPRGAYVRGARRNRVDPHVGEILRLGTGTRVAELRGGGERGDAGLGEVGVDVDARGGEEGLHHGEVVLEARPAHETER